MDRVKVKMRNGQYERYSIPKDFLELKMGVEKDELDQILSKPQNKKHRKNSLNTIIRHQNNNGFLNDLYGI